MPCGGCHFIEDTIGICCHGDKTLHQLLCKFWRPGEGSGIQQRVDLWYSTFNWGKKITFLAITVEAGEFDLWGDAGAIQEGFANTWKAESEIHGGSFCESVLAMAGGGKGTCSLCQGRLVSFRSFTLMLHSPGSPQTACFMIPGRRLKFLISVLS